MSQNREIKFEKEARNLVLEGINEISRAVAVTLGAKGKNVIIGDYTTRITKDGVTVARAINFEDPYKKIGADMIKEVASNTCDATGDGPQPLYSKVLTPKGFVAMGDIKTGDEICGTNGSAQIVFRVYPKGRREIFKVKLFDDRIVECCEDHLWQVTTNYGKKMTMTVRQLLDSNRLVMHPNGKKRHGYFIPFTNAEFNQDNENMPIHPYLLGLLLGDGSLSGTGGIELSLGASKEHVINKIILPKGISIRSTFVEYKNSFRVKITGQDANGKYIAELLDGIGLLGVKSDTKFIPKSYLYSNTTSREQLFQGLMDTDGHIDNRGNFQYSTVSEQLSNDFMELCRGLGKLAKVYKMVRKPNSSYSQTPIYRISQRNGFKYGVKITGIEATGEYTDMQCIKVSNQDNLYMTDNYVVTHNTTTAAILAQAIIYHGLKHVEAGASPISLKRGMDIATKAIVESMQSLSRPCNTKEEIRAVAIISANNDEDLGGKVAEVMSKVGADGVIDIQTSETSETTIDSIEGMKLDSGFISPYLITEPSDFTSRLEKPYLLITDMKITSLEKMIPIMELAKRNARPLFIIGSEFGGDALTGIVANHVKNNLRMCAIKPPGIGINQKEILEDLAILTGGEVLTDQKGIDIDNINLNLLGSCERIITDKLSAIVVGGDGDKETVDGRKENIRKSIKAAKTEAEKSNIKDRLARMENGVAIIRVGANSETELSEKRDRIEDSVGATTAAMEGGIVPGGGVALALAGHGLVVPMDANDDVRIGMMIIKQACEAPIRQLAKNCGVDSGVVYNKVIETGLGYNALTNKYEDLLATGVIDPLLVPKIALQNAVSVASLFLTTDCIIVDKK